MTVTPSSPSGPAPSERSNGSSLGGDLVDDTFFGRVVTEQRLATPEEVAACSAKQKELAAAGKKMSLAEIMVRAGYLTGTQVKRMGRGMDDSMTRPAQQIPGFQIIQRVGAGAMATVYKAKQISLDRVVAIKVLPKRLSENREFVDRFYKEGRAAAKLNHNNIVQAIDVGEHAGFHYFVMEFIDGKTVYDDLVKNKLYAEREAIQIVLQVASALQHAHQRGLIHRDVKPKNIMITTAGVAKLADMGLAREANDVEAAMAEAGRAYGTPYYIAPEQIRGEVNIDARADIYSLGATFYHMVTGRVPFDGPTPSAVMHKHLKEPLTPPDHINKGLSTGLAEVIECMMAKDRELRYSSAADVIRDLESVARGEPPPLARQRYDSNLLERLADGTRTAGARVEVEGGPPVVTGVNWNLFIAVSALLLVSVVLNVLLLVRLSSN
ncbi:MAG: serine/threonine protein kinase [Phycisphaerae bacterium]|nr:serine/threonine protein kinase [Phycisphaerae bacterium]